MNTWLKKSATPKFCVRYGPQSDSECLPLWIIYRQILGKYFFFSAMSVLSFFFLVFKYLTAQCWAIHSSDELKL